MFHGHLTKISILHCWMSKCLIMLRSFISYYCSSNCTNFKESKNYDCRFIFFSINFSFMYFEGLFLPIFIINFFCLSDELTTFSLGSLLLYLWLNLLLRHLYCLILDGLCELNLNMPRIFKKNCIIKKIVYSLYKFQHSHLDMIIYSLKYSD